MRRFSAWAAVPACFVFLLVTPVANSAPARAAVAAPFSFNWAGGMTAPVLWSGQGFGSGWDVQIHKRAVGDGMDTMDAQHGSDCAPPPATHTISTLAEGVFICRNHVMTSIIDSGYGEIALTPDHMVDFSSGTATISISVSTLQNNPSDWIDLWITPFADNLTLPIEFGVDNQTTPPLHAVRFSFNRAAVLGSHAGDVQVYNGGGVSFMPKLACHSDTDLSCVNPVGVPGVVNPSSTLRTPYQIDISAGHVKFGLPGIVTWVDTNFAFPFTQGIVQLVHHSYDPHKHCGCGVDTWHWSNLSISQAVPFTIISGNERSLNSGTSTVHFGAPSPASSYLRFSGIGSSLAASWDGGATWNGAVMQGAHHHDEHFQSYMTPIPAGVTSVMLKGSNWWGGAWQVRDPAIWAAQGVSPVVQPPPSSSGNPPANGSGNPPAGGTSGTGTNPPTGSSEHHGSSNPPAGSSEPPAATKPPAGSSEHPGTKPPSESKPQPEAGPAGKVGERVKTVMTNLVAVVNPTNDPVVSVIFVLLAAGLVFAVYRVIRS